MLRRLRDMRLCYCEMLKCERSILWGDILNCSINYISRLRDTGFRRCCEVLWEEVL